MLQHPFVVQLPDCKCKFTSQEGAFICPGLPSPDHCCLKHAHFHLRKAFSIFITYWHTCGENSQLPPIFLTVSPDKPLLHNLAKPYFVKPDPRNFPFPTNHQFYLQPLFTTPLIFNRTLAMLLAIYLLGAKDDCRNSTLTPGWRHPQPCWEIPH